MPFAVDILMEDQYGHPLARIVSPKPSPILSNLVCIKLDKKLMALAADHKWIYTRYADDLTFSGKKPFKKKHIQAIRNSIREAGFIINEDKVQKWKKGELPEITGLILKNNHKFIPFLA